MNDIQPLFMGPNSSGKQWLGIYRPVLVGGRWSPNPQSIERSFVRCTSRRWSLLFLLTGRNVTLLRGVDRRMTWDSPPVEVSYMALVLQGMRRSNCPRFRILAQRTAAVGSTTARLRVVSKCALSRKPTKEKRAPRPIQDAPSLFSPAGRSPSSHTARHFATNEPPVDVVFRW